MRRINELETENSLLEESEGNSKRGLFKSQNPHNFLLDIKKDNSKKKNNNIITNFGSLYKSDNKFLGSSIYHKSKKLKEPTRSINNNIFKNIEGEIKISSSRDKNINLIDKKRKERLETSKSIKKKRIKSVNNQIEEESKKGNNDSPINFKGDIIIKSYNIYSNNYLGEKIMIKMNNLNMIFNKFKESNNIIHLTNQELSNDNIFLKRNRLSCIINNSPFVNSNICLNNKKCETSIIALIGEDKCRFLEKNKNFYKGKSIEYLLKKINPIIFQEIDSDINDKLYELDAIQISIGQLYQDNNNHINEDLRNRYVRNITNLDGNGILKAFIFNYLEQIISRKDIKRLTDIIGRIKVILKSIKKDSETIDKVLSVFRIIMNYIEKDNLNNALIILIKSFSENYDFEKNIMIFMRQSLSESIKRHQSYFIIEYLKDIVQKNYIKINEKNKEYFNYELYNKEIIESLNNELQYELLIFYFLPLIFNIDLIIYTDNATKTNKIKFNHTNFASDDKDLITIELFIKFGSIFIIYSNEYYKKFVNIIPFKSKNMDLPLDKIQIIKNQESKNCYMCHEIPFEFILIDYKFEPICQKCLRKIIKIIIEKRYSLFSDSDCYFHEEYYCNKINYTINPEQNDSYDLNISINDIKYILNNNLDIASEIRYRIIKSNTCDKCEKNLENDIQIYIMDNCGHFICSDCLKDYILKATDDKVVLNYYEYKLKQIKFLCPKCNKDIYLSKNLINNLFNDDKYKDKAEERLVESANTICCFCYNNNDIKSHFVIENEFISSNFSEDNYLLIHSICKKCFKDLKKDDLNNKNKLFFCDFCGENHHYDKIKFRAFKKRRSCCIHF